MVDTIISCEHASPNIPEKYQSLFAGKKRLLKSHRGWDIGAVRLAERLSRDMQAPLYKARVSRLLIDLNRSLHHPGLFSEFSRLLDRQVRERLIDRYYQPYRDEIEKHIQRFISDGSSVVHLSVHSFTPVLKGVERNCDIGLLYDPSRDYEPPLVKLLIDELNQSFPGAKIRRNYPYRGTADGFTTRLRARFTESRYVGIEFEVNQKLIMENDPLWQKLRTRLGPIITRVLKQQTLVR